jgi:hypothetical protein
LKLRNFVLATKNGKKSVVLATGVTHCQTEAKLVSDEAVWVEDGERTSLIGLGLGSGLGSETSTTSQLLLLLLLQLRGNSNLLGLPGASSQKLLLLLLLLGKLLGSKLLLGSELLLGSKLLLGSALLGLEKLLWLLLLWLLGKLRRGLS